MSAKQTLRHAKSHWKPIQSVTNKWLGLKLKHSGMDFFGEKRNENSSFPRRAVILSDLIKISTSRHCFFSFCFPSLFLVGYFLSLEFFVEIVRVCVSSSEARKMFGYKTAASPRSV